MKKIMLSIIPFLFTMFSMQACGPSEEQLRIQELAREDSLQQAHEEWLEQTRARQDSARQALLESLSEGGGVALEVEETTEAETEVEVEAGSGETNAETVETPTVSREEIEYSSNGAYSVQVGAGQSQSNARALVDQWQATGYENVYIEEHTVPTSGVVWYRVRIGNFDTFEIAERMQTHLQEEHGIATAIFMNGLPVDSSNSSNSDE